MRAPLCLAVVMAMTACRGGGDDPPAAARGDEGTDPPAEAAIEVAGAPETFYAVREHETEIVEVATASGEVRRTVLDVGPYRETPTGGEQDPNTYNGAIDLAPDGRTLYYSAGPLYANGSVYRLALPDGEPEQLADGHGPSVSPDGRKLAYVAETAIHIRDLASGEEKTFPDAVGVEGHDTTWSTDSTNVAFLTGGVDSFAVGAIDTTTGKSTSPRPADGKDMYYTPYSPKYRSSDGLLAVICCGEIPDPPPDRQEHPPGLVLHDPVTGEERERIELPFAAGSHDYDTSGTHHLLTAPGGDVYLHSSGSFLRIPEITGVGELTW